MRRNEIMEAWAHFGLGHAPGRRHESLEEFDPGANELNILIKVQRDKTDKITSERYFLFFGDHKGMRYWYELRHIPADGESKATYSLHQCQRVEGEWLKAPKPVPSNVILEERYLRLIASPFWHRALNYARVWGKKEFKEMPLKTLCTQVCCYALKTLNPEKFEDVPQVPDLWKCFVPDRDHLVTRYFKLAEIWSQAEQHPSKKQKTTQMAEREEPADDVTAE